MEALEDRSLPSTLLVTSQADDGTLGTIRYEVGLANSGDTIAFALPIGTTSVSLSKGEILINKNLTINGGGDSVSAGGNSRIFEIGPAATVTMTNLTLDNGFDATGGGGAIRNEGNLTLVSCYLFTNTSKGGDGHGIPGATPGVSGGGGAGGGGAISNLGSLTINNSTLFNNYAQGGAGANANDYQGAGGGGGGFGGAVFDLGGVVTITDSTFTGNFAIGGKGGDFNGPRNNSDGNGGSGFGFTNGGAGGISSGTNPPTAGGNGGLGGGGGGGGSILGYGGQGANGGNGGFGGGGGGGGYGTDFVFGGFGYGGSPGTGGGAGDIGEGGIYEEGGYGGSGLGGAVANYLGSVTISNCTIYQNQSRFGAGGSSYLNLPPRNGSAIAGGVYNYAGQQGYVSLKNTIVAGSPATAGLDLSGPVFSLGHNLIEMSDGSTITFLGIGDQLGSQNSPINPMLGPVQNNGGPTLTCALLPGSPAIDAGDNTGAPLTDQRGFARSFNGTTDIGAFEFQNPAKAVSTASLSASVSSAVAAQPVTFVLSISALLPGAVGNYASGTASFTFDGVPIPLIIQPQVTLGTANFVQAFAPGVHTIVASYGGDSNYTSSISQTILLPVYQASASTAVVSSGSTTFGQSATFTATVSPVAPSTGATMGIVGASSGMPSGSVYFYDGVNLLGGAPLASGHAALSTSTLGAGSHSITAVFLGDTNFTGSTSNAVTQTIGQAGTTTSLVSEVNPTFAGKAVTLLSQVIPTAPGTGLPTGTVTFMDGIASLGSANLSNGIALFTTTALSQGSHSLTVIYNGDANFRSSTSPAVFQTVVSALTISVSSIQATEGLSFSGQVASVTDAILGSALGDLTTSPGGATINWGDNSPTSAGVISQPGGPGTPFTIKGSHTYPAEGSHSLSVTVGDKYSSMASGSANATVLEPIDLVGRNAQTGQWTVASSNGASGFSTQTLGSWSPSTTWVNVVTGDFNGDGIADLAGRNAQTGQWMVSLSNGSGFTTSAWGSWSTAVTWVDVKAGDFTGDGKTDIVGRILQNGQWWLAQSTGSSFTNILWGAWSPNLAWVDVQVGDFNGDGKADLIGRWLQGGQWWAAISNGTTSTNSLWASWSPSVTWVDVRVGDLDGHGKADIIGRAVETGQWWAGLSTGSSFSTSLWAVWSPAVSWVDVKIGDLNGDGKADIVGRVLQTGQWWASLSNGSMALSTSLWATWSPFVNWTDVQLADFSGDGLADLTGRDPQTGNWWTGVSTGSGFTTSLWGTWSSTTTWADVQIGDYI